MNPGKFESILQVFVQTLEFSLQTIFVAKTFLHNEIAYEPQLIQTYFFPVNLLFGDKSLRYRGNSSEKALINVEA